MSPFLWGSGGMADTADFWLTAKILIILVYRRNTGSV